MLIKNAFVTLLLATLAVWQYGHLTAFAAKSVDTKSLKLVSQYKRNKLQDISSDGKMLLYYETSKPVRIYRLPPSDGKIANQPDANTDVLRVVERDSGRELARITVGFFPQYVRFIPGTERVFYTEPKLIDRKLEWRIRIWDFANGEARECSGENVMTQSFSLIDSQHVLKITRRPGKGERLAILAMSDCSETATGPIENSDPIEESISFSKGRNEMAYVTNQRVVIRNTATLNVINEIKPTAGMNWGQNAIYTPDGKFLVVLATNTIFDKPDTKRFLYFYDTTNFQLVRQLDITSWSPPVVNDDMAMKSNVIGTAIAFAPDSRTMAIAYTNDRSAMQQALIVLYDLETAKEIARAYHPAVRKNREDPFAARIAELAFTPDGKFLLSSTHDTLIWEVQSK